MMTEASLVKAVRAECGKVDNSIELEDVDIIREGNFILDKIAERIVEKNLRYITSEADKREYDVHANTIRVQEVITWEGIDEDIMKLGDPTIEGGTENEYYDFPSLWTIRMMRRKRGLPKVQFQFNPVEKKLKIDPMPEEDGTKYYYVSVEKSNWTLSKLPSNFESLLVTGTTWKCLDIIAMKRSNLGGIHREGGMVTYPATEIHKIAADKKKDFYQELNVKALLYSQ